MNFSASTILMYVLLAGKVGTHRAYQHALEELTVQQADKFHKVTGAIDTLMITAKQEEINAFIDTLVKSGSKPLYWDGNHLVCHIL